MTELKVNSVQLFCTFSFTKTLFNCFVSAIFHVSQV